MKICAKCKKEKNDDCFTPSSLKKNSGWCRMCNSEYHAKNYENNRDKLLIYQQEYIKNNKEKVALYQKEYANNNKEQLSEYQKEYNVKNSETIRKRNKNYKENNKEYFVEYGKKYRNRPGQKEKTRLYNKEYQEKNKYHIKEYNRERYKNRDKEKRRLKSNLNERIKYNNDPIFKLRKMVSKSVRNMLKGNKKGSILKYLPYTMEELKAHIEGLFEDWMTWENWGIYNPEIYEKNKTWQLDHKVPHSFFHYETMDCQEFQDCWALTNLRPLSSKQNLLDGNRR